MIQTLMTLPLPRLVTIIGIVDVRVCRRANKMGSPTKIHPLLFFPFTYTLAEKTLRFSKFTQSDSYTCIIGRNCNLSRAFSSFELFQDFAIRLPSSLCRFRKVVLGRVSYIYISALISIKNPRGRAPCWPYYQEHPDQCRLLFRG